MTKALVIDDSSTIRSIICKILAGVGIATVEASNGQHALEVLAQHTDTALVLVDWNMPIMNGIEFVRRTRSSEQFSSVKIVMVTTEMEMEQVAIALESGIDEYIMKPFTKEILEEKLHMIGILSSSEETFGQEGS
jgi:two-component system chemotaxis response regulator CheY